MTVYVNGILTSLLRAALPDVPVFTEQQMADDAQGPVLPRIVAAQLPGGSEAADPRFSSGRPQVQIDAYATTRREANELCARARAVIVSAWRLRTVTPDGVIAGVLSAPDPSPLVMSDQASGEYRFSVTLALLVRDAPFER